MLRRSKSSKGQIYDIQKERNGCLTASLKQSCVLGWSNLTQCHCHNGVYDLKHGTIIQSYEHQSIPGYLLVIWQILFKSGGVCYAQKNSLAKENKYCHIKSLQPSIRGEDVWKSRWLSVSCCPLSFTNEETSCVTGNVHEKVLSGHDDDDELMTRYQMILYVMQITLI